MKILLTGASGFIGRHILAALHSAGHEVMKASRASGVDFNHMSSSDDWLPHLQGIDAVINSVGIIAQTRGQSFASLHYHAPAALFHACAQSGIKRVIQISALGADEHAFAPYQLSKKSADDVLRSLALEWFVLRPSLVYGAGGKSTALFQRLAALPVVPLVGQGIQRIQPVHIDDLVSAVMACLSVIPAQRTIDVVGPEAMTFAEWLTRLRKVSGKSMAPTLSIPFSWVLAVAKLGRHIVPMLHPDNLRMLQQGNTADAQPFARVLGRMPRELP